MSSKFFSPRPLPTHPEPAPAYVPPVAHEIVTTAIHPAGHVVVLETKASKLSVGTQETVLSWDTIEATYLSILALRLQERGLAVNLQQLPTGAPTKH